jgi:hypothetical protein
VGACLAVGFGGWVQVLDRYLAIQRVELKVLQLFGATSLLLSSKLVRGWGIEPLSLLMGLFPIYRCHPVSYAANGFGVGFIPVGGPPLLQALPLA